MRWLWGFLLGIQVSLLGQEPHLLIEDQLDNPLGCKVSVCVRDATSYQKIEIKAIAIDKQGEVWTSQAEWLVEAHEEICLKEKAPLPGSSYEGVDGMGLFWSMLPSSKDPSRGFRCKDDLFQVHLELYADGRYIESKKLNFYQKMPSVQVIDVHEEGLVGKLMIPFPKAPVIIVLGGSNGGIPENRAKVLASHGFATLALGYFGKEGLPERLERIPLEYFTKAIEWLRLREDIDASRVGIYGVSRGAELSLLLGSLFPSDIQAIVAALPSSVVNPGLGSTPVDAWVYQDRSIKPFAPVPQVISMDTEEGSSQEKPLRVIYTFLEGMKNLQEYELAAIEVEKIACPVLVISGGDDQMWPSFLYAKQIFQRMRDHGRLCQHLHYPKAGHGIGIPYFPLEGPVCYHPVGKKWFSLGGSREEDSQASADSWEQILTFFYENLTCHDCLN